MQCSFHFSTIRCITTLGRWIVSATKLGNLTILIFDHFITGDKVGVSKTNFSTRSQAEKFLGWVFAEIFLLDVKHTGEGNLPGSHIGILRVVHCFQHFGLTFRIICYHHFQWIEHTHKTRCAYI